MARSIRAGAAISYIVCCSTCLSVAATERKSAAARFLGNFAGDLDEVAHRSLADEAIAVIEHSALALLFGPQSRAEVELLAQIHGNSAREIVGRVDRLAVPEDAVWFADFKTGMPPSAEHEAQGNYVRSSSRSIATFWRAFIRIEPCMPCSSGLKVPQYRRYL